MGIPRLVGMVHLGPLPGSPRFCGDFDATIAAAMHDAEIIAEAGFDGVMVENFGDAPFFASDVPKVTIAAMTTAVNAVYEASRLPVGINVLRNDGRGALAVAAATPASFVRVNILSGMMFTDQGPIVGESAEIARLRSHICPDVSIMADVFVKHSTPPPGLTIGDAVDDLTQRAGADAVVVSGRGTGAPIDLDHLKTVSERSSLPLYLGSGGRASNIASLLKIAHGAIVGTSIKIEGVPTNRVDRDAALAFVEAAK